MRQEEKLLNTLKEYHKNEGKTFDGAILLNPEDYRDLLQSCSTLEYIDKSWTFNGLILSPMSDEDIGWTALEFTGWDKNHPELLAFIKELDFRELFYKETK